MRPTKAYSELVSGAVCLFARFELTFCARRSFSFAFADPDGEASGEKGER